MCKSKDCNRNYMKEAVEMSNRNIENEFSDGCPFGAIIIDKASSEVVGRGKNNVLLNNDPTAHAEVSAIRDACSKLKTHDLSGCILYTSCYPCPMCLGSTMWANIDTIYYGNTRSDAEDIGFRDDFIYNTIHGIIENGEESVKDRIELIQESRDLTIPTFTLFKNQEDKKVY